MKLRPVLRRSFLRAWDGRFLLRYDMGPSPRLLDLPLAEIEDQSIRDLVSELHDVTTVPPVERRSLFSFVSQVLYPAGGFQRYKLEKDLLTPGRSLLRKVSSFRGTGVYRMCDELAALKNQTAELGENMALYVFLNKYLPDYGKKPKPRGYDPRQWR